jgi:hypothetical protein
VLPLPLLPPSTAEGAKGVGVGGVGEDVEDGVDEGRVLAEAVAFAVSGAGFGATTALVDSAAITLCLLITHNCLCTSLILSSVNELLCTNKQPQSSQTYSFKLDTI